jgi:pseudaminic acid synthase
MVESFSAGNRRIGPGQPAYVIAEMSANHAGSLARANDIVRAAADAGADAVKIQTYTPDTMTIDCDRPEFVLQDGNWAGQTLYDLYEDAHTPLDWHEPLKNEAEQAGIDFFSTAYEETSADFLQDLNVDLFKIASFEATHIPLIEHVASFGKPIILSTGLASLGEIEDAVQAIRQNGNPPFALLACTSAYPAPPEEMHLERIPHLRDTFQVPTGLSDHSMGTASAVASVGMGGCIIEKHFCLSRDIDNPDSDFSMEPDEFQHMVDQVRTVESARGSVQYGVYDSEQTNESLRRSLFVVEEMKEGDVFSRQNLRVIRPAHGLPPKHLGDVIGKTSRSAIAQGTPLSWQHIR